ncbi:MAG: Tad domain-containing protein [Burkholderiales bacterium]|nr:Tad domain-containing protein [Burkholderiales bacterium]
MASNRNPIGPGGQIRSGRESQDRGDHVGGRFGRRGRLGHRRPAAVQRGQALVLALVLMFSGLLALYFLFSVGQVAASKQRLTNTADAAAYSTAVWRARVLNFQAYSNRAIVAQEVAVAQAVTLTSWAKYFEQFMLNASRIASVFPPLGAILSAAAEVAEYARELTEWTAATEIEWRAGTDLGYKALLQRSQEVLYRSADSFGLGAVANEVARANDPAFFAFALGDDGAYARFSRRYETDEDRRRLQGVVTDSLSSFVGGPRTGDVRLPLPSGCTGLSTDFDHWFQWWRRRGGTEMSPDLERWEAADTGSIHDYRRRGFFSSGCRGSEILPLGWGAAQASSPDHTYAGLHGDPGGTSTNGAATAMAESTVTGEGHEGFERYSGIERVRELDYAVLSNATFPTSQVVVLARAEANSVRTAPVLKLGAGSMRLADERFAGDRLWAMAVGEVYFRRPPGAPARNEYASLYSPYWQARLAEPSDAQRAAVMAYVH